MAAHYVWKWRVIDLGWVVVVISVVVVVAAAVACERERWGARTRVKTLRGCELCGKRGGATKSTALLKGALLKSANAIRAWCDKRACPDRGKEKKPKIIFSCFARVRYLAHLGIAPNFRASCPLGLPHQP
jgi:hypothetical protein